MTTTRLERIIAEGNRRYGLKGTGVANDIVCADGFRLSVIAGGQSYATPRSDWDDDAPGPFTEVEVGFPSARPEPWSDWEQYCEDPSDPTETVYGYVPVGIVRALVASHGGER